MAKEGCCIGPNLGPRGAWVTLSFCYGEPTKKWGSRLTQHLLSSTGRSHTGAEGLGWLHAAGGLAAWQRAGAAERGCASFLPPPPASFPSQLQARGQPSWGEGIKQREQCH